MHRDTSLLHSPPQSYPHFLWNQTTTYHRQAPGKMIGVLVFPGNTRASEQDYLWTIHVWTINKPYLPIKNRPTYSATSPLRRMCFSQYHLYWVCKQFINAFAKWPPPPLPEPISKPSLPCPLASQFALTITLGSGKTRLYCGLQTLEPNVTVSSLLCDLNVS